VHNPDLPPTATSHLFLFPFYLPSRNEPSSSFLLEFKTRFSPPPLVWNITLSPQSSRRASFLASASFPEAPLFFLLWTISDPWSSPLVINRARRLPPPPREPWCSLVFRFAFFPHAHVNSGVLFPLPLLAQWYSGIVFCFLRIQQAAPTLPSLKASPGSLLLLRELRIPLLFSLQLVEQYAVVFLFVDNSSFVPPYKQYALRAYFEPVRRSVYPLSFCPKAESSCHCPSPSECFSDGRHPLKSGPDPPLETKLPPSTGATHHLCAFSPLLERAGPPFRSTREDLYERPFSS